MFEEPYRWVEAVGNRRQYLDAQFTKGSPVIALSCQEGVLLFTVSRGTSKLYEIYDHLALGGMGHPADLEKLRFSLLEMAHLEGFNRSPSDVTGARLVKYGIAPVVKQAFEEIYKAPFIVKILLAQVGVKPELDAFLTVDYDGTFEERNGSAVLAAFLGSQTKMLEYAAQQSGEHSSSRSLQQSLETALLMWALGSMDQARGQEEGDSAREGQAEQDTSGQKQTSPPDKTLLLDYCRRGLADKTLECAVLERKALPALAYRLLSTEDLKTLLPSELHASLS